MVDQLSPLGEAWRSGSHGNFAHGTGASLSETQPGSIVEIAAWRGNEAALRAVIKAATGLDIGDQPGDGAVDGERNGFGIGPGRFLLVDGAEGLAARLASAVTVEVGTVTDLSHGRTAIRIEGAKVEWVLAKLYALDFSVAAFPVGAGRATAHHDFLTQIQRTGDQRFELYVYRSFARAFWKTLCHAAEDVGYEVG